MSRRLDAPERKRAARRPPVANPAGASIPALCAAGTNIPRLWVLLAQQRQDALRRLVRLGQHAGAGLLQDLELRERDHLRGHVRVADTALRRGQVLLVARDVGDGVLQTVLDRTERRASSRDVVDGIVDLLDVGLRSNRRQSEHGRRNLRAHRDGGNGDLLRVSGTDLERDRRRSRLQQVNPVEVGLGADALDLGLELIDLGLNREPVVGAQRAVLVLHGQLTNTLKHAVNLVERTLSGLHHRNGVRRVAGSLRKAADLAAQLLADGQARGVVAGAVDAVARRQLLHRLAQTIAVVDELTLSVERLNVVLDTKGHRTSSLMYVCVVPGQLLVALLLLRPTSSVWPRCF